MAPKAAKKPKEPEGPPSEFVARGSSKEWMTCAENKVTHTRPGRADSVRGKQLLAQGRFRITYEITHTSSPDAQDVLLGVCDAAAWSADESKDGFNAATDQLQAAFGHTAIRRWQTFGRHGHAVAWGIEPKTGRLVSTPDVCSGRFGAGVLGGALVENERDFEGRPIRYQLPRHSTVVLEVNMLDLDETNYEVHQRSFSSSLHPLQATGLRGAAAVASPVSASERERRTLSVSVNGGEFVDAGVSLPPAVFPWVMLTWQGDTITMTACEKFNPKIV